MLTFIALPPSLPLSLASPPSPPLFPAFFSSVKGFSPPLVANMALSLLPSPPAPLLPTRGQGGKEGGREG
jgi:hypothetical protein